MLSLRGALILVAVFASGCVDYLAPGELGTPRYFGEVRGAAPLELVPPLSDLDGNLYVLYGAPARPEALAFVGHRGGGWSTGCNLHKGANRGMHGWVGRSQQRAWYWSGNALVEVAGADGTCQAVLDRDPRSNADLAFLGVIPWVRETPSQRTVVALIQSPTDPLPFLVVVDLDLGRYTRLSQLAAPGASRVAVLGTGADPARERGVFVLRYELAGEVRVEALFVDREAREVGRAEIQGAEALTADAVRGYLGITPSGTAVGLLDGDRLLVASKGQVGELFAIDGMTAAGLHRFAGELWLVGENAGPVVARVADDGGIGPSAPWQASIQLGRVLGAALRVLDDRGTPRRYELWSTPTNALSVHPFLSAHSPHEYADGTTLSLVAGPSFIAGGEPRTSVAVVPTGISYP